MDRHRRMAILTLVTALALIFTATPATAADPLGLGLELGLGSDEARQAGYEAEPAEHAAHQQ